MSRALRALWANRSQAVKILRASRPMFSQFGEDIAIRRLLRPRANGVYVDVGANDPYDGSNTAFLYMLGWSGLVIEPNPGYASAFKKARPRDRFVNAGVAREPSELTYFRFKYDKLNTFSASRADQLVQEGKPLIGKHLIKCLPLSELIKQYLPSTHVDLLSVDCEGLDLEVLESANLGELRPTALVVEDFIQYLDFRDGRKSGAFDQYLRSLDYSPVFQCAWSSIYVANDWRNLVQTGAFDPPAGPSDYMPKP